MIKITPENNVNPAKGKILLSEPFLADPYFKRAAILLCEHNDEGSFGFVLNNYISMSLDQIMQDLPDMDTRVSVGGPVKNSNLYYMHTLGESILNSTEVVNGIYLGGDFSLLKKHIYEGSIDDNQIRFFVGYSGWSANQLNEELEQNSWFVTDAHKDIVMDTESTDLWGDFLKKMGPEFARVANLPKDPKLN
ncbi:MAG: YqgE/AlgH family protein [Flavobacteriales bacterium]